MTTLFTFKTRGIGDLVKHEYAPYIGYSREEITVDGVWLDTLPMGSLVCRAVADTVGNYALVDVAGDLASTKEFAITLGDTLGEVLPLEIGTSGTAKCAAVVRGPIILSDKYVFDVSAANGLTLDAAGKAKLVHLLKKQGIILEITL